MTNGISLRQRHIVRVPDILENIMQDIGRWYNLNVVFANNNARNYHLHFLADKRGGIDHVVKLLNGMGKVNVTLKDNTSMATSYFHDSHPTGSDSKTREVGFVGAANYSYADRYLVDFSYRAIGSSVYGSDNHWGGFKVQELSLRYAQAVYKRSAKSLVTNLKYARQDNDTKKIEVLETILKKYGISESENEEISKDHQRMMLDEKEQSEHMAKIKK